MGEVRIYKFDRTPVAPNGGRWFTDVFTDDVAKNALVAYKKLPPKTPLGSYHYHEKCENFLIVLQGQLGRISPRRSLTRRRRGLEPGVEPKYPVICGHRSYMFSEV